MKCCKVPCYNIDVLVWIYMLEVWCYGRVSSSFPISDTCRVIHSQKQFATNIQKRRKYELIIFVWTFSSCLYSSFIFTLKCGTGDSLWLNVFMLQICEMKLNKFEWTTSVISFLFIFCSRITSRVRKLLMLIPTDQGVSDALDSISQKVKIRVYQMF